MLLALSVGLSAFDFCGRVNIQALPEQALMELLVANIEDHEILLDDNGDFTSTNKWKGLTKDDEDKITDIEWSVDLDYYYDVDDSVFQPGGSIDLQYLPPHLVNFKIADMQLHSTIETSTLPRSLKQFDIQRNCFTGSFELAGLPSNLIMLLIPQNELSGSFDLSSAPRRLLCLDAYENNFFGALDLTNLGPELNSLRLEDNAFTGIIDLRRLPSKLTSISLQRNKFAQEELVIGECHKHIYIKVDFAVGNIRHIENKKILKDDRYKVNYWTIQIAPKMRLKCLCVKKYLNR